MTGKHLISIDDFIGELRSFERSLITRDRVLDLCSSVRVTDSSLDPYVFFDDKFYTRNLIYRDHLFEVIDILLQAGEEDAVHTPNRQLLLIVQQRRHFGGVDLKRLRRDHPE